MKKLLAAVITLVLTGSFILAQQGEKIYTTPKVPTRAVLDRLNLKMAWNVKLRTQGQRDGFLSVQVIPGSDPVKDHPQVLVQTFHGSVILLDGENGDLLWRTETGQDYWPGQPAAAFNSRSILSVRKDYLYVLNRFNGHHRVFLYEKETKLPQFGFRMHGTPSTGIVADEIRVFIPMENKLMAYLLPDFERADMAKVAEVKDFETRDRLQRYLMPNLSWSYLLPSVSYQRLPLLGRNQIGMISSDGRYFSFSKEEDDKGAALLLFDYKFNRPVSAAMAMQGEIVYIPCEDATLYALNISGRLMRRFLSGSPIMKKPEANDRDVYVAPERMGLICLDSKTGREKWTNKTLERYLSTDFKFVWAADRLGQLYVLDYARGTELAKYDTSGFVVPITNDLTDRMYFASHDGQIMCLHHKDHRRPVRTKTLPPLSTKPKRDPLNLKEPEKKDPEKKDPDKKDPDKKDPDKKDPDKKDPDKKDPDKKDPDKKDEKVELRAAEFEGPAFVSAMSAESGTVLGLRCSCNAIPRQYSGMKNKTMPVSFAYKRHHKWANIPAGTLETVPVVVSG